MKRLLLILIPLVFFINSCRDELLYDYETQHAIDVALIDQYLSDNDISHELDNSGLRFEVLNFAQGEVLSERQFAVFEITIRTLDGAFYGSTNEDIDINNGGEGRFYVLRVRDFDQRFNGLLNNQYFAIVTPRMTLGDSYRVYVPSALGFGFETENLQRPLAPNTNLIVEIEMIEIIDYGD